MEQEKTKNNGLIILVILLCLMILGLGGYIVYDKILSNKEIPTNQSTNTNTNENNQVDDSSIIQSNSQVTQDSNIDLYKLEAIYNTLGIDKNETRSLNHCLNYNLSTKDYLKNSKKIFSLYAMINEYNVYNIPLEEQQKIMYCDVVKSDNCQSPQTFFGAAAARVISKPRANIIISKYNLHDTDFLMDFPHVSNIADDLYGYYTEYASGGVCDYIIKHNIDIQENEVQDVTVVDKQIVIKLKYDEEKSKNVYDNEINQTVTYILKHKNNNYNLDSVSVK